MQLRYFILCYICWGYKVTGTLRIYKNIKDTFITKHRKHSNICGRNGDLNTSLAVMDNGLRRFLILFTGFNKGLFCLISAKVLLCLLQQCKLCHLYYVRELFLHVSILFRVHVALSGLRTKGLKCYCLKNRLLYIAFKVIPYQ